MKTTPGTGSPVPRIGGKRLDHRFDYCSRRLLRRYHSPCTVQLQIVQKVIKISFLNIGKLISADKNVCVNLSQLTVLLDFYKFQIIWSNLRARCSGRGRPRFLWKSRSLFISSEIYRFFIQNIIACVQCVD